MYLWSSDVGSVVTWYLILFWAQARFFLITSWKFQQQILIYIFYINIYNYSIQTIILCSVQISK